MQFRRKEKKKFWCRNIFTSAIAIFNASALWALLKEFQIKSWILSKVKTKKNTLNSPYQDMKVKKFWSQHDRLLSKCLIWAIGPECHNGFLNVYFPCVCDKILQFSWHLSKRRDILLALENLSFSNLSSQKITKQFFDTLILLNAILKADERKKEIKITETFLNNKLLLLDRILRTSLSYGVSDE